LKELENDSKYKIVTNLVMELKNDNSNASNVVLNILHPMILFFSKNIEDWIKERNSKVHSRVEIP